MAHEGAEEETKPKADSDKETDEEGTSAPQGDDGDDGDDETQE